MTHTHIYIYIYIYIYINNRMWIHYSSATPSASGGHLLGEYHLPKEALTWLAEIFLGLAARLLKPPAVNGVMAWKQLLLFFHLFFLFKQTWRKSFQILEMYLYNYIYSYIHSYIYSYIYIYQVFVIVYDKTKFLVLCCVCGLFRGTWICNVGS